MHWRWLHCSVQFLVVVTLLFGSVTPLNELDEQTFADAVDKKAVLLVLIGFDGSGECEEADALLNSMEDQGVISQAIPGIAVYKQKPEGPVKIPSHRMIPLLVLVRGDVLAIYTDSLKSSDSIYFWLEKAGPSPVTQILTDDNFEQLTQASTGSTTGHWAVLFYRKSCEEHMFVLESVGVNEKLWLNVAKVDLDSNPKLEKRFKITECLELIYFRKGKMYRYETKSYEIPSLTSFVNTWYNNVKGSQVPVEPTAFDKLTENIALYLKSELEGENRNFVFAVCGGTVAIFVITIIFCCVTGGSDSKQKKD